jgi:hypothetical protein
MPHRWIAGLGLFCLLACPSTAHGEIRVCEASAPERASVDSWYHAPPTNLAGKWTPVNPSDVHRIARNAWKKAEPLLRRQPIVGLSWPQAERLIGQRLARPAGMTPYLVRAVYFEKGAGRFSVSVLDDSLLVDHGSLGPWPVAMRRDALVVLLKDRPREVYVTCGGAS